MSGMNPNQNQLFVKFNQSNQFQAKKAPEKPIETTMAVGEEGGGEEITTLAYGEEGGDMTTMALGEEGGGEEITTLAYGEEGGGGTTEAIGEEGGGDMTTMALGEEGGMGDSIELSTGLKALEAADANGDGEITEAELQTRDKALQNNLSLNAQKQQQIQQTLPFLESLNTLFGGSLTPIIEHLQGELARLVNQEDAMTQESDANQFMQDYYGEIADQDAHIRAGNPKTISGLDLNIAAPKDGNADTLSTRDLGIPSYLDTDPPEKR